MRAVSRATRALIHLDALKDNLECARELAAGARVMAALKANAYGHGLKRVARALAGADAFAVATLEEARALRENGARQPIILLEGVFSALDLQAAESLHLDVVVHHRFQVELLEAYRGAPLTVWLKLDTGMHRLGVAPGEAPDLHQRLNRCAGAVPPIKLMSHLACAEQLDNAKTHRQRELFDEVTAGWPGERSLANSAGLIHWPETRYDWVRVGGALYGILTENDHCGSDYGFTAAMTFESRLIAVNRVEAGEQIGYGGAWTAPEAMPVGVVAVGYGDGYPRHAASGTPIVVAGVPTQTIGRVSMDLLAVDLRPVASAGVGDRVILWGEALPAEQVARAGGTISYELTSGLTSRVPLVNVGAESDSTLSSQSNIR